MKRHTLLILLAALAVMAALAVAVSFSERPTKSAGGLLLPGLATGLEDADSVRITRAGNLSVASIRRGAEGWSVDERHGYPANVRRLRKNLLALANATIIEEKTSNPDFYDRLRVEDVEAADAGGLRIDLHAGNKLLAAVIVGNTGMSGSDSAYVRRVGEAASWLVNAGFELSTDTVDWTDQHITSIPAGRVAAISITQANGGLLQLTKSRAGEADYTVEGIPEGREPSFAGVGNVLGGVLADLELDDVMPAADLDTGKQQPVQARFETFDGLVIDIRIWQLDDGSWLQFSASSAAELAPRHASAGAAGIASGSDGATDIVARAMREDLAAVETEAAELNRRLGSWVYTVPDYKVEQLTRRMEDLLAPAG